MSLLERLADHNEFVTLSMNEKLLATLYVAILGMGITFLVLIFLQYCISLMSALLNRNQVKESVTTQESNVILEPPIPVELQPEPADEELIAVLTAAVAACLGRSADQIVVRNVLRVRDGAPNWARAGLVEQMSMRK